MIAATFLISALVTGSWLWTPDKSLAQLQAKYLQYPADMIDVAGTRLHVRDSGPHNAPAVLLLHGFGSSLQTWEPWAQMLDSEFRVVRLDLPGSGLSPPDPGGVYTDQRTIDVLVALLDRLKIPKVDVIGNSIGGRIAWRFAVAHPERIERLVLISPDGFASPGFNYGKPPAIPSVVGLMRYVLPKALLRMNLKPAYGNPDALTEETVTRYHDLLLAPGSRAAVLERMRQSVLEKPEPLLRTIHAPVLLVWGVKDAMIPIANAADYTRNLPDSRLVTFPNLGHVPQEEAPAESIVPVRAFLEAGVAKP